MEQNGQRVLLMRTWSPGEAEMVRQLLLGYGIPCQVVAAVSQRLWPTGFSEARILVPAGRRAEARGLLAEHRREGLDVLPGGRRAGSCERSDGS
jgi:hypothetical protein